MGTRSFGYTYDAFGRQQTVTYPDGTAVERQYHSAGHHVRTRDITDAANPVTLWALGDTHNDRGQTTSQRYGNGLISRYAYNLNSGRIAGIITHSHGSDAGFGDVQHLGYRFDTLGNLTSRTSARAGQEYLQENFEYDRLNRLMESTFTVAVHSGA